MAPRCVEVWKLGTQNYHVSVLSLSVVYVYNLLHRDQRDSWKTETALECDWGDCNAARRKKWQKAFCHIFYDRGLLNRSFFIPSRSVRRTYCIILPMLRQCAAEVPSNQKINRPDLLGSTCCVMLYCVVYHALILSEAVFREEVSPCKLVGKHRRGWVVMWAYLSGCWAISWSLHRWAKALGVRRVPLPVFGVSAFCLISSLRISVPDPQEVVETRKLLSASTLCETFTYPSLCTNTHII